MRGENTDVPNVRPRSSAAQLVDRDGNVHYYLITSKWVNGIITSIILLLVLCIILMVFTVINRHAINTLEQHVATDDAIEHIDPNSNSQ